MRIIVPHQPNPAHSTITLIIPPRALVVLMQRIALGGILLLAAALLLFRLGSQGWANEYYAASVHSMLQSWHNFWFVSFDGAGFLAVDKPPLALWVQAASAKLFGWNSASVLLPQALAALLAVAVLFHLVRRSFGAAAGTLAALALALTPIAVATGRNNTMDSMLVLVLLLAAWACGSAANSGRLLPLLGCALWIGVGFNIKMAQAFLVLPAFVCWYWFAAPLGWQQRARNLAIAGVALAVFALPWVLAVDLTPAAERPFIASSSNSEIDLLIGHNGGARIVGNPLAGSAGLTSYVTDEIGAPGPARLWGRQLGGQASWLIPLALLGALAAWRTAPPQTADTSRPATDRPALAMWAIWLVTCMVLFSVSHKFHRYYLVMLAPPVAALAGAGLVALWHALWRADWGRWLLPAALAATTMGELAILRPFGGWVDGITLAAGVGTLGAAAALVWFRQRNRVRATVAAASIAVGALLLAPALWSATPLQAANGPQPFAGPDLFAESTPAALPHLERLIDYLHSNQHGTRFIAATTRANTAAPLMLETNQPVMTFGGYSGGDDILTPQSFAAHVAARDVQFVLLPAQTDQQPAIVNWVNQHCAAVPAERWRAPDDAPDKPLAQAFGDPYQLFDCGQHP